MFGNMNRTLPSVHSASEPLSAVKPNANAENPNRNARRSSASVDAVRSQIDRTPDLREEKLAEVREKIRTGQYNDPDVVDHLAEALSKNIFVA